MGHVRVNNLANSEEGLLPHFGEIQETIHQRIRSWRNRHLEGPYGTRRHDLLDAKHVQCHDIGPVVDEMGWHHVSLSVTFEDTDIHVPHGAPNTAHITKRGFDAGKARIGKDLNTVDPGADDKTNRSGHNCSSGTSCLIPIRL